MDKARSSLLVGIVLLGGIAAFIGMYSVTKKSYADPEATYAIYARFDDASGLGRGNQITVAGVQVGEVVEVGIDPDSPDLARVKLVILNNVELKEGVLDGSGVWINGATITRKQASLLGDPYLEITRGISGKVLGDGDEIRNAISVSGLNAVMKELERSGALIERIDSIFQKVDTIAADIQQVTRAVRNILGGPEGEKQLEVIANNISQATEDITAVVKEVREFTMDARAFMDSSVLGKGEQIGKIIDNVERFSASAARLSAETTTSAATILSDVKAVTGDIRVLIRGSKDDVETSLGTIKGALASFTKTMSRVDEALGNVASITKKIDDGDGTLGKLVNDDRIIKNIEEVVADAGDLVKRVTGLQTRVELNSEYYFNQSSLKNSLRLRLQPKEDKYYLLEIIDDPRGKTSFQSQVTQTNDPSLPPVVHESTATTSQGIKFSFQFAKKWYFVTGRFGVFEGTGGLGVDFEFLDDTLKFAADIFDFSQDEAPRLRMLASYEFFKHFYISAGVDDVLNPEAFDWFFGGGLRFTDDDLKALFSVAPIPGL